MQRQRSQDLYQACKLQVGEWERVSAKGTVLNNQFSRMLNALKEEVGKRQNKKFRSDPEGTSPTSKEFDEWSDVAQILTHILHQQIYIPLDVYTEDLTLREAADSILDQKDKAGTGKLDALAMMRESYANFIKPKEQRTWGKGAISGTEVPETPTKFKTHEIPCYSGEGLHMLVVHMRALNDRLALEPWMEQDIIRILWHNNDGSRRAFQEAKESGRRRPSVVYDAGKPVHKLSG